MKKIEPGLYPVIHVKSYDQARKNTDVAIATGSKGVFLINHGMSPEELLCVAEVIVTEYPKNFIGVNPLGLGPVVFQTLPKGVSALWYDNSGVGTEPQLVKTIDEARAHGRWQGHYFGGVAFKGQKQPPLLAEAVKEATKHMDVIVTSGPATGRPPNPSKIMAMRQAAGDFPIAIASGITPENIGTYLAITNIFMVATGISTDFHSLDPARVKMLVDKINNGPFPNFRNKGITGDVQL